MNTEVLRLEAAQYRLLQDQLRLDYANLDDETFAVLRTVLFGSDSDPWPQQSNLNAERAGILLEVMRDLLYQTFVRKARLLQALTFRKFVAPTKAEAAPAAQRFADSLRGTD